MKKVLLAVIMVLCFASASFAFMPMMGTSVYTDVDQIKCGSFMLQSSTIDARAGMGNAIICASTFATQNYVKTSVEAQHNWFGSSYSTSFSAGSQTAAQSVKIFQMGSFLR